MMFSRKIHGKVFLFMLVGTIVSMCVILLESESKISVELKDLKEWRFFGVSDTELQHTDDTGGDQQIDAGVLVEQRQVAVLVEQRHAAVLVEQRQTAVLVEQRQTAVHVEQRQATVLVEPRQTAVLVEQRQTAVLVEQRQAAVYDLILEGDPNTVLTRREVMNARRENFLCERYLSQQQNSTNPKTTGSCQIEIQTNETLVPKIAIYVIFGAIEFKFIHYLSVLSAQRFFNPDGIYVVGDSEPNGPWWDRALKDVLDLKHVYWQRPSHIYGHVIPKDIFASDVVRHQILLAMGGIYLDTDIILLKDMASFRGYDVTMGLIDSGTGIGNGLILTKPATEFLRLWYKHYITFDPEKNYFGYHSMQIPYKLWQLYPESIHVEVESFYTPGWNDNNKQLMFAGHYNWTRNFAIHIWTPPVNATIPKSEVDIYQLNTTLGEIARFILFGKPDLILPNNQTTV